MSVERQRSRVVTGLILASLAQDTCLLLTNVSNGLANLCGAFGQGFHNYSRTFGFIFNDQQAKYEALTGRSFAGGELAQGDEDDDND